MNSLYRSIAVAAITFGASVVGMLLQWAVPADVLTASKGSVGAMVGLITLLLALVLGLLVFTAFSVYTTQQTEAQSLGPVVIELDVILEQYGADVAGARTGLREALGRARKRFFGDLKHGPQAHTIEETRATMHWMNTYFERQPPSERHRQLLTTARDLAKKFAETNMLMARQLTNPFPPYVLAIVVCWAAALFLGNGLVAAPNAITVLAHLAGAIAIGSAIFLILELSTPYTGLIRLTSAGLDRMLEVLAKADQKETPAS
ncbi:MAG TPA: hypothetical protein VGO05_01470 [Roseiarcus sp.]|jgi:hypothetical protein|nr:hypothetical protein [Roseiarcus sp.]